MHKICGMSKKKPNTPLSFFVRVAFVVLMLCNLVVLQGSAQPFPLDTLPHSDTLHHWGTAIEKPIHQQGAHIVKAATEIYGPHELPANTPLTYEKRKKDNSVNYVTLWILFSLVTLSIARFLFPVRFTETMLAAWQSRFYNQIEREGGLLSNWVSVVLFLNFLFSISLLLYLSLPMLGYHKLWTDTPPMLILIYALVFFACFYIVKYLVMFFVAWVFKTSKPTESYFRNILIVNQFGGIALLPLLIIHFYNPANWILYAAWILTALLATYKIVRVSFVGLRISDISAYHLILYLCTIEIAPVLFLIKFSNNLITS